MTYNASRFGTHTVAAFAAVFLALTSIGTIVTVPEAQAHAAPVEMPFAGANAELA